MRTQRMGSKVPGGGRVLTPTQAAYELKHRVVQSLNKLSDRDTYQIGAEELAKVAEGLTPEGIVPFLSCVIDTDSEQKSAVRKECIRVLGTLAKYHGSLVSVHIGKMVASIVKRLKDPDSTVRDSCVETAAVFAMTVGRSGGGDAGFMQLVKPFFEALGEQNRYVQTGAAMCLTRVFDVVTEPPVSFLSQMLSRIVKLLKNQHFMAKPDVIGLIRSIVQAGGATSEQALQVSVTSITESLKCSDWKTRKAASLALAEIAFGCRLSSEYLTHTCISSLECCRFDKVKPVRDAVVHALQCWKAQAGTDSSDPSEVVSSTKDITNRGFIDLTCNGDTGWRGRASKASSVSALSGISSCSIKKTSLAIKKKSFNQMQDHHNKGSDDLRGEVPFPKGHTTSLADDNCNEPQCLTIEDVTSYQNDSKSGCSIMPSFISEYCEAKNVVVDTDYINEHSSANVISINSGPENDEVDSEVFKSHERNSMASTVTDVGSHGCSLSISNELTFIRKQLLDIKAKQSELLELLEVFVGDTTANLLSVHSKIHNLEGSVDEIAQSFTQKGSNMHLTGLKYLKKKLSVSSLQRLSTCTARQSFEYSQHSTFSSNKLQLSRKKLLSTSGSTSPIQEGSDSCHDQNIKLVRDPLKENRILFPTPASMISSKQRNLENEAIKINDHMCSGDLELAYEEVLSFGNYDRLFELMNTTGPVLEKLSQEIVDKVLDILPRQFLNHRFISSMIPWLQQVVTLSELQGPKQPFLSGKTQIEFLQALMGLSEAEYLDRDDRFLIVQIAVKLSKVWGEAESRKIAQSRSPNGSIKLACNAKVSQYFTAS